MSAVRRLATIAMTCCTLASGQPVSTRAPDAPSPRKPLELWFYCSSNLLVDENVAKLAALFARAGKAGYTRVLLADAKFSRLSELDPRYFRNVEKVKEAAKAGGLEIVPAVFPIGYSEGLLSHDPNLAEALPVVDQPFVVEKGTARLVAPGFPLAQPDWKDDCFVAEGTGWRARDVNGANARVVFKLKLTPRRQYHVSLAVETKGFDGDPRVQALVDGKGLIFSNLGVQATQGRTVHHAVFNSLDHTDVSLYVGAWGANRGELWIGDLKFEEVGLLNVVRRDGTPLEVKRADGTRLVEGRDFEKLADPRMGCVPWPGAFEVWHEPPPLKVKAPDGTPLKVSYHHAITVMDGQVMICPSEQKTVELLRDEAKRIHSLFGNRAFFLSHDEIRVMNQDESCRRRHLDAGRLLADDVRTCIAIAREVEPKAELYVWSDMFDPNHNARADYYLVRGDLAGSWEGLDPAVVIANWNFEKRDDSLAFFAARGHRQLIAAYYDAPIEQTERWLASAQHVKGVGAVMYTTWQSRYDDLERFADAVRRQRGG